MAEPTDPTNTGQGEGPKDNGGQGGGENTHKNVSFEDFQKLTNQFNDFSSKLDAVLKAQNTSSQGENNKGTEPKVEGQNTNKGQNVDPSKEFGDRLTKAEKELSEYKAKEAHQNLLNLAKTEAKNSNVNIDGIVDSLVGKDEESTKANVKKFVDTVKANTKSTDTGFQAKSSQFKNSDDFMNLVYKSKGIAKK
ncbi:capsid assembly scaffolding protein Gp46 family protein [Apilactobacillus xinyiensis]|uniref:capsid assembly scaffolding protein Gp46 family protein n=1 Tax=Apilactobacillus xinyiensis TaxID=2841032 RepID=UPI001C7CE484|nr:DUF4355 domain-containing protein [Apilactobacillus xinyiensis]